MSKAHEELLHLGYNVAEAASSSRSLLWIKNPDERAVNILHREGYRKIVYYQARKIAKELGIKDLYTAMLYCRD